MLPATLHQQLDHMEWADALLWQAALSLPQAHSDPRMQELLYHVHLVQQLYLQTWRGEPLVVTKRSALPNLSAIQAWAHPFYADARAFLTAREERELQQPVHFPWEARLAERFGTVHPATLEESALQVVLHTAHHRAQLCTRLRELGGEPPLLDFIAWIWQGKPAPGWPDIPAT